MESGAVIVSKALERLFDGLPERLSIDELTEVLGLSDRSVTYKWLREGRVPAMKLGSSWFILRDDVREHLEASYNVPRARASVEAADVLLDHDPPEHNEGT